MARYYNYLINGQINKLFIRRLAPFQRDCRNKPSRGLEDRDRLRRPQDSRQVQSGRGSRHRPSQ